MIKRRILPFLALAASALLAGADQFIKYLVSSRMELNQSIPVIQDILHLTYSQNTGAAFGIAKGQKWLLIGVTGTVLLAAAVYLLLGRIKSRTVIAAASLIIAGGVGNLIDRVRLGYVVDYIDVTCINFAIFNLADSCVCIGTALLLLHFIASEIREAKAKKAAGATPEDAASEPSAEVSAPSESVAPEGTEPLPTEAPEAPEVPPFNEAGEVK